jgi:hypothetical protein
MARHRAMSRWWRRSSAQPVIPVPRQRSIELVDALSKLTHRVSPDELAEGRQRGDCQALCGARLLPASLTEPGRGWCAECARE